MNNISHRVADEMPYFGLSALSKIGYCPVITFDFKSAAYELIGL
jgi:hypothetical protein